MLIFSTICVRIKDWECWLQVPQKKSLQRKNKKDSLEFQSGLSKMSLLYKMVEVEQIWLMTSLRSRWQNFFKFDGDFISEKYSPKILRQAEILGGCLYFCNPLCSNLPFWKIADDLCKLPDEFTPDGPFIFIHFPLAVNSNTVRFLFAGRCWNAL